jgi:hypothetical protein
MPEAARHFRLLPASLPAEEQLIRTAYVPTLLLVIAFSTVVYVALGASKGGTPRLMLEYGVLMVAYMAYVAFWSPLRMKRRLKRCWETYDLEIGPDYFLRRQADLPDLRLSFAEVRSVEHVPGRYLRVIGKRGPNHFDTGRHRAIRPGTRCRVFGTSDRVAAATAMAEISILHGGGADPVYDDAVVDLTPSGHSAIDRDGWAHPLDVLLDPTESQSPAKHQDHCLVLLAVLIDVWHEIPYRGRRFTTASPKIASYLITPETHSRPHTSSTRLALD